MTRPIFLRVVLSLLLLMSQQMASTHALSHLGTSLARSAALVQQAGTEDEAARARLLAADPSCDQCLVFAQLAAPLGSSQRLFVPADLATESRFAAATGPACGRALCAFQPRGPPQA